MSDAGKARIRWTHSCSRPCACPSAPTAPAGQGPHYRKAPEGDDRPAYFIHLAQVGWMLQDAGLDDETVAAGFLHDIIEDYGYTQAQLAQEIGYAKVA